MTAYDVVEPVTAVPPRPSSTSRPPPSRFTELALYCILYGLSVVGALGLAAVLLALTGHEPSEAYSAMWDGSFGSKSSFFVTLNHTAPILVVAVGACIAGRAGLINLGLEGQFLIGGMAATAVAVTMTGPKAVVLPIVFVAAVVGGFAWAGIAAALKYWRGISEVLTTLLLNFVALQLVTWIVSRQYLLQAQAAPGAPVNDLRPQSELVNEAARLPFVTRGPGFALQMGIVLAVVIALLAAFVIARTRWGFQLRLTGFNARTARRFGLSIAAVGTIALAVSGALAGLAGAAFLTGGAYRLTPGLASNYGWEGLLVGLIVRSRPLLAIPVALLYGAVRAGGGVLTSTGVSPNLVGIVQALIVVSVMLPELYMRSRKRKQQADRGRT